MHSLDKIRPLVAALIPKAGGLHGAAAIAAMLTCVAVVLNVGPFANAPRIDALDGLDGSERSAMGPSLVGQPNGPSAVAYRKDDAQTPPAYQLSAVESEGASKPVQALQRTSSDSVVEGGPPASRSAVAKESAREVEVQPQGQGQATQPDPSHTSPEVTKKGTIVGIWAPDAGTCSARDFRDGVLPTVINTEGAWAGETFCMFTKKEKIEMGWTFLAKCSNPREHWTSSVRLTVSENRLTWTSNRGAQAYTRCELDVLMADAK